MKPTVIIACALSIAAAAIAAPPAPSTKPNRVFVQIVSYEGAILAAGVVVVTPEDAGKTFGELVEKQIAAHWWGFSRGAVYRFSTRTQAWEHIMTRDVRTTESVVGGISSLRLAELEMGDVVRLSGEAEF